MNCAKNCENLLNFLKVIPKTLLVSFFLDTVYISNSRSIKHNVKQKTYKIFLVEALSEKGYEKLAITSHQLSRIN